MKPYYTLVYQGGISNVFEHIHQTSKAQEEITGNSNYNDRIRIMQSDFKSCEDFCRGLKRAGALVRVAWCNEAGDISNSFWEFYSFDRAPFCEKFKMVDLTK